MIVNPGVNAYPLFTFEIKKFEEGLGKIFSDPDIECVLSYSGKYVPGITDIDILVLTTETVTDKEKLLKMGERILELYESFGYRKVDADRIPWLCQGTTKGLFRRKPYVYLPRGVDMDMWVHDEYTFARGMNTYNKGTIKRLSHPDTMVIAGKRPENIDVSESTSRSLFGLARDISRLRTYPLMKGVIRRFEGEPGVKKAKCKNLTKVIKLPRQLFSYMHNGRLPKSMQEAFDYIKSELSPLPHDYIHALLVTRDTFFNKLKFLASDEYSDELLLNGTTYYEMAIRNAMKTNEQNRNHS